MRGLGRGAGRGAARRGLAGGGQTDGPVGSLAGVAYDVDVTC